MTEESIVAIYDTPAQARAAVDELRIAGVPESAVSLQAGTDSGARISAPDPARDRGFWANLFGGEPDHDTKVYDRSLESGSAVVSVSAPASLVARTIEILDRHSPVDIDERASGYGLTHSTITREPMPDTAGGSFMGSTPAKPSTLDGAGDSIQLSEESLEVGKRVVNRGSTRIRRFVVETPVERQVTLRDETVTLERRPVADGRRVAPGEFGEKTIEVTETREEPVVSKAARVYEEVGVRKEASERTETIRDTVRKEEVEIERAPEPNAADAGATSVETTHASGAKSGP